MSTAKRGVAVVALLAACRSPEPAEPSEFGRLEQRVAQHEQDLDRTEAVVRRLESKWAVVVADFNEATRAYRQAEASYDAAGRAFERASVEFENASVLWQEARARWELATQLIVAAAALDAYNLAQARGANELDLDEVDCGRVSTRTFRRRLEAEGISLKGKDIDHIVPHALGGADHPSNYQILDSSLNRSLGARFDAAKCSAAGQAICAAAIAVSKLCGSYGG